MAFGNKEIRPRKKSYYPFSKNYPSRHTGTKYAIGETRNRRRREKINRTIFIVCLLILFVLAFIIASVAVQLSKRPYDQQNSGAAKYEGQLKALYMPEDVLDGGIAFDLFKTKLADQKANAVLVDFKDHTGKLNFPYANATAKEIGATEHAYDKAAGTIAALKSADYKIIARVYCYMDTLTASKLGASAAITKADGSIWLDESAQNDGNPWLNPYSSVAENYLLDIVEETASAGADVILLDGVQFPDSIYLDTAVFAGADTSIQSRNFILHHFIEKAAERASDIPICVLMTANGALNGDASLYDGSIFDSAALLSAIDFRKSTQREGFSYGDATYTTETTDMADVLRVSLPILQSKLDANYQTSGILPILDNPEYVAVAEAAGIQNYILFLDTST